ncbi:MAG: hypothetical protein ACFFE7_13320 [Candidatus Thorarchaeota archaeon]
MKAETNVRGCHLKIGAPGGTRVIRTVGNFQIGLTKELDWGHISAST